jgi:hypothetical protein
MSMGPRGNDGLNHSFLYKPIGSPSPRLSPPSWAHAQAAHDTYLQMSGTGRLGLTWLKCLAIVVRNFNSLFLRRDDVEQRYLVDTAHHL